MTITWPTSGTTICHGNTRADGQAQGPDGLNLRIIPSLRPREYVGGGGPDYEDQGNTAAEVSFAVTRIYTTPAAAAADALLLADTPTLGTLAYADTTIIGALRELRIQQTGAALRCQYQFVGRKATP